jgi:hypothetical protein
MYIRNEIKLATVPIYLVLLAFVVGGTAILARMAPALDEVLSENVASVEASAEMLAALAQGDGSSSYAQRDFHTAFEHARANITEEGEAELIGRIETHMDGAFAGDPAARSATVEALIQLERLNVASMRKASEGARSLGGAGMAAIVMFASIAIVVGLRSRRRLYRSIVNAVVELSATMRQATEAHDSLRRVSATQCATELALVADGVNRLLDERARRRGDEVGLSTIEKAALNRLLDRQSSPTMLVSRAGDLLAASSDVLAAIDPNRLAEVIDAARAARGPRRQRVDPRRRGGNSSRRRPRARRQQRSRGSADGPRWRRRASRAARCHHRTRSERTHDLGRPCPVHSPHLGRIGTARRSTRR